MSLMRHWLAHDVQGTVVVTSEAVAAKYREHGTPLEGPFVPDTTQGAVEDADRLREVLRAVLMEPDPIKRNQLAAPVLTLPGGSRR